MDRSLGQGHGYFDECRFADFIVGPSNREAFQACVQVSEQPGTLRNPLLIACDRTGDGATLLTGATGNAIAARNPLAKIFMLSGEQFAIEMVRCVEKGGLQDFRNKYRECDALLIDGIQFLLGKPQAITELSEIIRRLVASGRQVVVNCCDYEGDEGKYFSTQLQQMLGESTTVRIGPSDLDLRRKKLRQLANQDQVILSEETIEILASTYTRGIREVQGAFYRARAFVSLSGGSMDLNSAAAVLTAPFSR